MENVFKRSEHLLDMTYVEIEEKNLEMKKARKSGGSGLKEKFLNYLKEEDEKRYNSIIKKIGVKK